MNQWASDELIEKWKNEWTNECMNELVIILTKE